MRESCLVLLLFHYFTKLASAWQVRAAALWMPFIKKFLSGGQGFYGQHLSTSQSRSLLSQIPHLQLNVSRAFWPTFLLPFTEVKIRNLIRLNHSKPGRSFWAHLSQCGFQRLDSTDLLHHRGPTTKNIWRGFPWIWDSALCFTHLFCVLFLSHFLFCSNYSCFCWWNCYFYYHILLYFNDETCFYLNPIDFTFPYSSPHPPGWVTPPWGLLQLKCNTDNNSTLLIFFKTQSISQLKPTEPLENHPPTSNFFLLF